MQVFALDAGISFGVRGRVKLLYLDLIMGFKLEVVLEVLLGL